MSDAPISAAVIADNISRLRKHVSTTEDELNSLRTELEWWETGQQLFGDVPAEPSGELPLETAVEHTTAANGAKPPPLRNRILMVLAQEPRKTWKTDAVIAELREHDWLPAGEYAEHHVRSMLAQMHRKGQARRMARGTYRLPPERKDMAEMAASVAAGIGTGAIAAHVLSGGK